MDAAPAEALLPRGSAASFSRTRLRGAALDAATGLACIATWSGIWTLLDEYRVHALPTGCVSVTILVVCGLTRMDAVLDALLKRCCCRDSCLYATAVYLWTLLLAFISVSSWRMAVFFTEETMLPRYDTIRACTMLALSGCYLIMAGRFSSIVAPPVLIAEEDPGASSGFMNPNSSGHEPSQIFGDVMSAIASVVLWDAFWLLSDQVGLPCGFSAGASCCALFCLTASDANRHVEAAQRAASPLVARVLALLWTCVLGSLSMWLWRGFWECLPGTISAVRVRHVSTENFTHVFDSLVLLSVGLSVLFALSRTRSLMFPPVITCYDDRAPVVAMPLEPRRPFKNAAKALGSGYGAADAS